MTHELATFDLQFLCPVHSETRLHHGYLARIEGFRRQEFVMTLEEMSDLRKFRALLLGVGSFHFCMGEPALADFLAACVNAAESRESIPLAAAHARVLELNSSNPA